MSHFLASHIHAARIGDDLVILDVRSDAYFCASGLGKHLEPNNPRTLSPLDSADHARFAASGFLGADPTWARNLPPLPRDGLDPTGDLPSGADRLRLCAALVDFAMYYPGRSFDGLLRAVRSDPTNDLTAENPQVNQLARTFHRLIPWAPIGRKCLVRSFLLRRFLERSGRTADWVFGVRTWPFGAHCWIQNGDVSLDDAPERLAPYQPILCI